MFGLKLFKRPGAVQGAAVSPPMPPSWPVAVAGRAGPPPPPPPPEAFLSAQTPAIPFDLTSEQAPAMPVDPPAEQAPARVRFFYTDGTVSEPDPQEAERLGYLATNLLEASREESP